MSCTLPILEIRQQFINTIQSTNRIIIQAPTGSGKSTQIPQILLDSGLIDGQILILQPRRLAARMLASRVASERGCILGEQVGYQTRFESAVCENTRIRFITEGILPRLLLNDRSLNSISAVIFDEFHERSLTVDLGLALIRDLQQISRKDLKLIVMSATLSSESLEEYLSGAKTIVSGGRTYPVTIQYFSEVSKEVPWVAACEAVKYLIQQGKSGDFLIFMPGIYEIRKTVQLLNERNFGESLQVMALYGDLSAESQRSVMEPSKKRKVIVATNIAETSLTIPGVRHVIDSGLARVNRYDQCRGFNTLYAEKISIDSADQRAGRAGREAEGSCIRLWSVADHRNRAQKSQPEVQRVDLSEAVLQLKTLGYPDPKKFNWFESPEELSMQMAQRLLENAGVFTSDGELSEDGRLMAKLPMHPRIGRLLIESSKRGILKQGALAAALLTERPVFTGAFDVPEEFIEQCRGSDFELTRLVIQKIQENRFDEKICRKFNVNISALNQVLRTQTFFLQVCRKFGMHSRDTSNDPRLLSQAILISYIDHLARRRDQGTLQCDLAHGRRGELEKDSMAKGGKFLIPTTIRELKSSQQTTPRTMLSLACAIDENWLREYFADKWKCDTELAWNSIRQAVESRDFTCCCGVVINDSIDIHPDPQKAGDKLASVIIDKKMPLNGWTADVQEYINRVQWISAYFPEKKLPEFNDEDRNIVIHELCGGEYRYDSVKNKPVLGFVKELLSWEQQQMVENLAPQFLNNPVGKKLRIYYKAEKSPVIKARIQELYGIKETPRIANGRAAVVIEILAPNMRPVQITEDLQSFWSVHYPELKKTLSRRYPKHEWR